MGNRPWKDLSDVIFSVQAENEPRYYANPQWLDTVSTNLRNILGDSSILVSSGELTNSTPYLLQVLEYFLFLHPWLAMRRRECFTPLYLAFPAIYSKPRYDDTDMLMIFTRWTRRRSWCPWSAWFGWNWGSRPAYYSRLHMHHTGNYGVWYWSDRHGNRVRDE